MIIKFLIYLIIFYLLFHIIKIFKKILQSKNNEPGRNERLHNQYKHIEEADYKDITNDQGNKSGTE